MDATVYVQEIEPIALSSSKFAPITSVDVDRSFSKYNIKLYLAINATVLQNLILKCI